MVCKALKQLYPITVSWKKNGVDANTAQIDEGAEISNTLTVVNVQDSSHGDVYRCEVESVYFESPTVSSDVEIWVMSKQSKFLEYLM